MKTMRNLTTLTMLSFTIVALLSSPVEAGGGSSFRTRPRFVEPGQVVAIRAPFGDEQSGNGGFNAGPYEVYIQRLKGRNTSGEVVGPEFHVGQLELMQSSRWGYIAYTTFVVPTAAGAGDYIIQHRNAQGEALNYISRGFMVVDPNPDAARRRFHKEAREARERRQDADDKRELKKETSNTFTEEFVQDFRQFVSSLAGLPDGDIATAK